MSDPRILLIGEGHGFEAAISGMLSLDLDISLLKPKKQIIKLNHNFQTINAIEDWIKSPNDLIISSAYRSRISEQMLKKATFINVHYALFPKYRGMHSIVWAILNGEEEVGVTFHLMNKLIDAGDILRQFRISLGLKTSWEIMQECDDLLRAEIGNFVKDFINGKITPVPQQDNLATYVAKRSLNDCKVDWETWDTVLFPRYLRALVDPYPKPFFSYNQKTFKIIKAECIDRDYFERNGCVVYLLEDSVLIKIKGGLLRLYQVQDETGLIVSARYLFNRSGLRLYGHESR